MKLTGYEAINYAEANGLTLSKYNDPIEDAREGLTPDEARNLALEDPTLIYVRIIFRREHFNNEIMPEVYHLTVHQDGNTYYVVMPEPKGQHKVQPPEVRWRIESGPVLLKVIGPDGHIKGFAQSERWDSYPHENQPTQLIRGFMQPKHIWD